ncbi:MAG: PIG-L family deacetylase [Bacteroidetes bacterium]|nr:PIG-L family deacetylase [Bacteroidota bacterium]
MQDKKTILVLAPHPDDGEFGAGGSLSRWASEGRKIHYVAFSPCIASLPEGSAPDLLHTELMKATSRLGIEASKVHLADFPVRMFPAMRQEILEMMVKMNKEMKPDLVLVPNSQDIHQDHHTIFEEGLRAFKHCSIIGYELPWNSLEFKSNFHVRLTKEQVKRKYEAISEYKSQVKRAHHDEPFLEGLARLRGTQIGTEFAEAFELIRWIS